MADPIAFEFTTEGADALNRTLAEITRRLGQLEGAHQKTGQAEQQHKQQNEQLNQSLTNTGTQAQSSALRLTAFGSTLGMAGQAVGRFSASTGQMLGTLGQATGSISALTAAMGPWGFAIGAVTTGLSLLSTALNSSASSTDQAASAARRATSAYLDMVDAIQQARSADERFARLRAGGGSGAENEAAAQALRQQIRDLEASVSSAGGRSVDALNQLPVLRADLRRLESALPGAERDRAMVEGDLPRGPMGRQPLEWDGSRGTRQTPQQRRRGGGGQRQAPVGGDRAFNTGPLGTSLFGAESDELPALGDASEGLAGNQDWRRAAREREQTAERRANQAEQLVDRVRAAEQRAHADRMQELEQLKTGWAEVGATALEGVMALASGDQKALGNWLKSFGVKMAFRSAEELATAIGLTIEAPPLAAEHYLASAKFAAIAAAAGGAGIAIGGGGGGSGGGRSSPRARADGRMGAGGDSGGAKTIVINMGDSKVLMGTKPEIGRALAEAIESAQQRWG